MLWLCVVVVVQIIARILRQTPQMVDQKWKEISEETKDLIKKLLIKQPEKRITCEEALRHPFFEPIREEMKAKRKAAKSPNLQPLTKGDGTNSSIGSIEDNLFPASRSVKDIKYGDVNGYSIKQERKLENIDDSQASPLPGPPAALLKQNSIIDETQGK